MSVLILGSEGSMGKRYQANLKHLGQSYTCADLLHDDRWIERSAARAQGIIIATPTNTHLKLVTKFSQMGKPILCEKPLVKTKHELDDLMCSVRLGRTKLRMTFQYQMLDMVSSNGHSHYDYFRHGNDGIVWDCMQIISLARKSIDLNETSPIWSCVLNGDRLNIADMDRAYIDYVKLWFNYPQQDLSYLNDIHLKVIDYEKRMSGGTH